MATILILTPALTAPPTTYPASCTIGITLIVTPLSQLRYNALHPAGNRFSATSCYAPEVVRSITSTYTVSVPAFSPMVNGCQGVGAGYTAMLSGSSGYVVCCPR